VAHEKLAIPLSTTPNLSLAVSPEIHEQFVVILLSMQQMQEKINELVEAVNALEGP